MSNAISLLGSIKQNLIDTGFIIDNSYLDKYCELIVDNITTAKIKYKTQSHHIIPRCYFKYINIPINNSKQNLINLLYKDHVLAHYYLYKCAKGLIKARLNYAFWRLYNLVNSPNFKYGEIDLNLLDEEELQSIYEEYVQQLSKDRQGKPNLKSRGRKISDEIRLHHSLVMKGKHFHTEESRKNISQNMMGKNKGKTRSEETKQKISQANKGKKPRLGATLTDSHKLKISNINKGNSYHRRPVICIETQQIFNTIKAAKDWCKGDVGGCVVGLSKTAGGYHWAHLDDIIQQETLKDFIGNSPLTKNEIYSTRIIKHKSTNKIIPIKTSVDKRHNRKNNNLKKAIECVETGQIFESLVEAKKWLGKGDIGSYIIGRQKYAGTLNGVPLHWRYV